MVIGRGSSVGLQLHDRSVSRSHARLTIRNRQAFLQDLGSTNGTWLGGQELPPREDNREYLRTKKIKMGHLLKSV